VDQKTAHFQITISMQPLKLKWNRFRQKSWEHFE